MGIIRPGRPFHNHAYSCRNRKGCNRNICWQCRPLCLLSLESRRLEKVALSFVACPVRSSGIPVVPDHVEPEFEKAAAWSRRHFIQHGCFACSLILSGTVVLSANAMQGRRIESSDVFFLPIIRRGLIDLDRSMSSQFQHLDLNGTESLPIYFLDEDVCCQESDCSHQQAVNSAAESAIAEKEHCAYKALGVQSRPVEPNAIYENPEGRASTCQNASPPPVVIFCT